MKKKHIKFLKQLVETPSPTGSEQDVAAIVRDIFSGVADEIQTDTMGSVHAILSSELKLTSSEDAYSENTGNSENETDYELEYEYEDEDEYEYYEEELDEDAEPAEPDTLEIQAPVMMLSAHMDEVGLMVTYISPDGFLSVSAIGGVDPAILPGMRMDVHTKDGVLRGVVGRKPIHLIEADERKNVTPLDKLVIDLGLPASDVKEMVRIGDSITYGVGFERYGKNMAVSKSFDDKAGVFVACRVMENLANDKKLKGSFVAAITVQEEIGTRGAITSAYAIHPDVAIAFDVTHATDYPGIDKSKYGDIRCGKGPVIARGPNINPLVFERLVAAAEAEGIPYQLEAEPGVTGTDARAIQVAQEGIPTGLISIPLRYMHTPTEAINLDDLEGAVKLLTRFALDLDEDVSFIPGVSPDIEHPESQIPEELTPEEIAKREVKQLKKQMKKLRKKMATLEREGYILPSTNKGDTRIEVEESATETSSAHATDTQDAQNTETSGSQNNNESLDAAKSQNDGSAYGSAGETNKLYGNAYQQGFNAHSINGGQNSSFTRTPFQTVTPKSMGQISRIEPFSQINNIKQVPGMQQYNSPEQKPELNSMANQMANATASQTTNPMTGSMTEAYANQTFKTDSADTNLSPYNSVEEALEETAKEEEKLNQTDQKSRNRRGPFSKLRTLNGALQIPPDDVSELGISQESEDE